MKKGIILLAVMFYFSALVVMAIPSPFYITHPSLYAVLVKNQVVHIKWTHGAYTQTCQVYCGIHAISPLLPANADDFAWTIGRKNDGTYMAPGSYLITIKCTGYDDSDGPEVMVSDSPPAISFTAPSDGELLLIGSSYTFHWALSSFYQDFPQNGQIIASDMNAVSPWLPLINGQFYWQVVGRDTAGTFMAPGNYTLAFEIMDYWGGGYGDRNITLYRLVFLSRAQLRLSRDSYCPLCYKLDPRQIEIKLEGLEWVEVELVSGKEIVAKLGKFGRGLPVAGTLSLTLKEKIAALPTEKSRQPGYELRFLSPKGKLLHKQAVSLELSR